MVAQAWEMIRLDLIFLLELMEITTSLLQSERFKILQRMLEPMKKIICKIKDSRSLHCIKNTA